MMQQATLVLEETLMSHPVPIRAEADAGQDLLPFRAKVFCLCLGFAGNAADARDLAQDTYAKALAHYARVRPENPQAWIMRIARNTCLDLARRKQVRGGQQPVSELSAIDWRSPEAHAGREEEIGIVRRAIAGLPRRQRDVLVMREYGELSYGEIAKALRISVGTVMSRLNRARRSVLKFYQEEHHERQS
jgi:RNA polymerase sigma-70 factor (ECF subfamily)